MEYLSVVAAAVASYAFGALWYMTLSKQWVAAANVQTGEDGRPLNARSPIPYLTSFICALIVAGMMRHVFALSGIDTVGKGIVGGFGIGLFLVTPWIATNYGFAGRPRELTLIDGGYATIGCTLMGFVLTIL